MTKKTSILYAVLFVIIVSLTGCLTMMKVNSSLQKGNYAEAINLLKGMVEKSPQSIELRNKLGFAYLKFGRVDEAIDEFNGVLHRKSGNPHAILYLGMAYLKNKEIGKAMNTWQKYSDKTKPSIEAEIKRQLTFLLIYQSHQQAKKALEEEKKLSASGMTYDTHSDENTIAVCDYQDLSPDKGMGAFCKALAAMLIADLSKSESLKVVERIRLQALLYEMKLSRTGIVDRKTAPRIGKLLKAKNLVTGNLTKPNIHATTNVTGVSTATDSVTVEKEKFFDLSKLIAINLTELTGGTLTDEQKRGFAVPSTTNYMAIFYYGLALQAFDMCKWKEARGLFEKALKEDPKFLNAIVGLENCPAPNTPGCEEISVMTVADAASVSSDAVGNAIASSSSSSSGSPAESVDAGGGGGCFPYDTLVLMGDNSLKKIVEIRAGDEVMAYDIKKGETVSCKVIDTPVGESHFYYLINGTLKVVPPHPFYTSDGEWVKIVDLRVGDVIQSVNGEIGIYSLEKINYRQSIYNINVENLHNFYVTANGKNFYLVQDGVTQ